MTSNNTCECLTLCEWFEKNKKVAIVLGVGALLLYYANKEQTCYQCEFCEKAYKHNTYLLKHQLMKHSTET